MSDEPKPVGVVVYKRDGETLQGRWTHPNNPGQVGREVVHGVGAGETTGRWPVDVYGPDPKPIFSGQLEITSLDQALQLKWTATGKESPSFTGIGLCLDPDTIGATFQET
jgi:hypothetical protein